MVNTRHYDLIRKYFLTRNETIAVAESVTSGQLQILFSAIKDAERFFQGGITTYNIGQKYKHLHVEPIHAKNCNCVSQKVAEEMARHVCEAFNSNWGIGITGYSTPVKESDNRIFCFYAICHNGRICTTGKIDSVKMLPQKVQKNYASKVLLELVSSIKNDK